MPRAIVLQHVSGEGPGRIAEALAAAGLAVEPRLLFAGEPVPDPGEEFALLVVMGGPMGVGDLADPRYPFLTQEVALLKALLAADRPVLGICLGAQLLAHAAGARVFPNAKPSTAADSPPQRVLEVGWGPVDFLGVDRDPLLAGLAAREILLHWHGDTFDLPPGATHLASSPACRHQAFRIRRQLGLQFHCEPEPGTIAEWVRDDVDYVRQANGPDGGARILADTSRHLPRQRQVCDHLVRNFLAICC